MQLLNLQDKQALLALLEKDKKNTLQFYEYLPYLSNEDDRFGFYGRYVNGELVSAVYFSPFNMGFTLVDDCYLSEVNDLLGVLPSMYIYGPKELLEKLDRFPGRRPHPYIYGSLPIEDEMLDQPTNVEKAKKDDIPAIREFYDGKDIMIEVPELIESIVEKGNIFIVKDEDEIVSAALSHSETDEYALIGGVYTEEGYEGNGYAYECVSALTQHLHDQDITPYLFYEARLEHLGYFYSKFSFEFECDYLMLYD
ncbi:GNAT family N-acetyltransferase [Thalassobacillus hwangdonensis]|uniref:GNAT family N-acetyltransferase n=1 Tax=Thalassobacillus hwangdonensis TaxID=546108 RepID=A0ABW3L738_9BACI